MTIQYRLVWLLPFLWLSACTSDPELPDTPESEPEPALPFTTVDLSDFSGFQSEPDNWFIAGGAYADRSEKLTMETLDGTGVVVNTAPPRSGEHLFTAFEHGDIELELEVMTAKNSNSGIYLQGRYEVQVFDSWGVESPQHSDMAGIYQRWDDDAPEGERGYEGHPPVMNAAKAPGLWQQVRILFHAPRFDDNGQKVQNARFKEVWLNGIKVHEEVELTGPTRAAPFTDEAPTGPIMLQGDHGPVAYRNIRYKRYDNPPVEVRNLTVAQYETRQEEMPDWDTLELQSNAPVDSISFHQAGTRAGFTLVYDGEMAVPETGDYLFTAYANRTAVRFIIGQDTLFDRDNSYSMGAKAKAITGLSADMVPFQLVLHKPGRGWQRGFGLKVEGPGVEQHALTTTASAKQGPKPEPIVIAAESEATLQRCFMLHEGKKRTHTVAVATPQELHYAYDLERGALLKAWSGGFLDATDMWHERGEAQLGHPLGMAITFHGDPELYTLEDENAAWPDTLTTDQTYRQGGYELDTQGHPTFLYQTGGSSVKVQCRPAAGERRLTRIFTIDKADGFWLKLGDGKTIEKLPDGTYAIDNHQYLIDLGEKEATLRQSNGKAELLLALDPGAQTIQYDIIW